VVVNREEGKKIRGAKVRMLSVVSISLRSCQGASGAASKRVVDRGGIKPPDRLALP